MDIELEKIINGLLCTDNARIRQATAQLDQAYENPQTLQALCEIVVSNREKQIRQFAAVLLKKRLSKLRFWQLVPSAQKEAIKTGMLQALVEEKEKAVKTAIAQLVGALVRHEAEKRDSWLGELLNFIYDRCNSPDPKESELGASIFATLTDAAPDQFISHMPSICQMFSTVLIAAETRGDLATPTVSQIMLGMTYLVPFVIGHTEAEQLVLRAMPLIVKAVQAFAYKGNADEFSIVFEIMDSLAEYTPKLLNNHVKPLVEFCLDAASNKSVDDAIRVQVGLFIGHMVRLKKKLIVKQKLLEPILNVVFEMMCSEADGEDGDDLFAGESNCTPVSAATQTLDLLALNMSPEKLIPPLLQLLEPALQSQDVLRRRAAFLCMAIIAEGCSEAVCAKYLPVMLNIINSGINDNSPQVRTAAFYALGQFSEHLQPEISKYAPQILPVLFDFLHQLVLELKMGRPEPKHMDRMFYALETFCEHLENDLEPHLPLLMDRLFDTLDPHNSIHVRELALSAIASAALAAKANLMPYFPKIVSILQNYMVKNCDEEHAQLRNQSIDALATIARVVGKENFLPLANDTISYCLMMLEDGPDDPDFRRCIYNLMGALSTVVGDAMSNVFPKIMDRMIETVISSEDVLPNVKDEVTQNFGGGGDAADQDIDLEHTDDEDDDEFDGYQVENDFVIEKEEAILVLKEFSANTGSAFAPYLQTAFENVYKVIDHLQEGVRRAAIEAICEFVISLNKMGDAAGVKRACEIVMPKFAHIARFDEEQGVVIHLLDTLCDVFKDVGRAAVPTTEIAEAIFACIRDVLLSKMACQFNEPTGTGDEDEPEESEYDELLIENAGNLLPAFGSALEPQTFSLYFGRVNQFYLNKLNKAKKIDAPDQRAFVYGALADSFQSLGNCVVVYFDVMYPLFMDGMTDPDPIARQNAFFGIGELVLYAEQKSYDVFPLVLQGLSDAISKETHPGALDNICGAVARLIITNHTMVPLVHVLPVFMSNLPLREDMHENEMVQRAFRVLYSQARPQVVDFIEQMLAVTIHVLYKKDMPDRESNENAVAFVKEVREHYPTKFHTVSNANPEVYNFVQSL
ncbi:importin-4-like isoform X2 [Scaptodrosophila lebanonensis]|nr:importin-4-like isoform X2 [Scaptodrosophila lebanonensis]